VDSEQTHRRAAHRRLLLLALASSAGVHAGLAPAHWGEAPELGALFALSAVVLAALTISVARAETTVIVAAAALVLAVLLAAYAATRFVALPPVAHAEPVDLVGVLTKLIEAGGLVLALRLLGTHAGGVVSPPALQGGAGR
jgi:hypothetical protein